MKNSKIIAVTLFLSGLYMFYAFYIRQGHVNKIYQHTEYSDIWGRNCKSTVVLIDDAPLSRHAPERLWQKNSKEIIEKWNPFTDVCDDVLFVKNNVGHVEHKEDIETWITEGAICLNGAIGGCISWEDRLFYVGLRDSTLGSVIVGEVNGNPIYIRFIGQ